MIAIIQAALTRILAPILIESQLVTIIAIVTGLLDGEQVGIAAIGRHMPGDGKPKSKMNRVYRFVRNPRIDVYRICEAMVRALALSGKIVVATDWTKIGELWVLVSAVVTNGRAIPIYWTVVDTQVTRLKEVEVDHMCDLARLLAGVDAVHVLDRGFDCAKFIASISKFCKCVVRLSTGFGYRRAGADDFEMIKDFPLKRGRRHDLGEIEYTKTHATKCRLVVFHDHQQKEPWLLATNVYGASRAEIIDYYARRFQIEESFKDLKDLRSGFGFRNYRMSKPDHLSRLLVIAALGYLVVSACGYLGEERDLHRDLQINTRKERELATWRVGMYIVKRQLVCADDIIRALRLLPAYTCRRVVIDDLNTPDDSPSRRNVIHAAA